MRIKPIMEYHRCLSCRFKRSCLFLRWCLVLRWCFVLRWCLVTCSCLFLRWCLVTLFCLVLRWCLLTRSCLVLRWSLVTSSCLFLSVCTPSAVKMSSWFGGRVIADHRPERLEARPPREKKPGSCGDEQLGIGNEHAFRRRGRE